MSRIIAAARELARSAGSPPPRRPGTSDEAWPDGLVAAPHARAHQPNVPGRGIIASYSPRFWAIVVACGVAAGLLGAALMELLRALSHFAWGYSSGSFLAGVTRASDLRRVLLLAACGLLAGLGGLAVRALGPREEQDIPRALWLGGARLGFVAAQARALLSVGVVALGASLGREQAPQLSAAAVASRLSDWGGLAAWQRRLLVASAAGAGMAAVYNVPLGGALFALEVLLGTLALPLVLPALAMSAIATAVAWSVLGNRPLYVLAPHAAGVSQLAAAVLIGLCAGFAAAAWVALVARAHALAPRGRARVLAPLAVLGGLGLLAIAYPQLLGNGRPLVQLAFDDRLAVGTLAVLLVLKPLLTAACLGSGAPGGLFTPTLAFGVLLGALLGAGWSALWPGTPIGAFATIGGAAVLAASMQGPLAALALMLELARGSQSLIVPMLLAVSGATVIARRLGAPSIYAARL